MRRWTLLVLLFAVAACKRGGSPAPEPQATLPLLEDGGVDLGKGAIPVPEIALPTLAPLVERISPSVVSLSVLGTPRLPPGHERFLGSGRIPKQERGGSGFIVDRSGLVVTNNHVVEGASAISVAPGRRPPVRRRADRTRCADRPRAGAAALAAGRPPGGPAGRLGPAARRRLAAGHRQPVRSGRPACRWASSAPRRATSARARTTTSSRPTRRSTPATRAVRSSTLPGQVIGVNTAIVNNQSGSRIGFAIPSSLVRALLPQLERTGGVVRGALGVYTQDLTPDLARALGLEGHHGAVVNGFVPGSSARAAGLAEGDVIVSLDGRPIESGRGLTRLVGLRRPSEVVRLGVIRGRQPVSVSVRLRQRTDLEGTGPLRPAPPDEQHPAPDDMVPMRLGVEIGEVTPEVEEAIGVRGSGALVVSVEPGSPAERAGLQPGLVIVEVAGQAVHSAKEASELIRAARAQPPIVFKLVGPGRVSAVATVQP